MALAKATLNQRATFGDDLSELTTVFVPSCPITWLLTATKLPSQFPAFPPIGPASCDPPAWTNYLAQRGFGYYSPAICPNGFSVACTVNDERSSEGFPAIKAGETAMYCVPSGFTCTSDTTDFRGGIWGFTRTASTTGASVTVGPAIQIRWRQEDLSNLATDPLIPGPLPTRVGSSQIGITTTTTEQEPDPITTSSRSSASPASSTATPNKTDVSTSTTPTPSFNPVDTSTSTLSEVTPTTSSGSASNQTSSGSSAPSIASSTSIAAMALSGTLIAIILGILAVTVYRRYRRYRAGEIQSLLPLRARNWFNQFVGKYLSWFPSRRNGSSYPTKKPDAELEASGPTPELGGGDMLGTKENPAELAGSSVRNSWMSQVSRIFTIKSKKDVSSV
ncbi:uncharacterized protein F4822DRAFT_104424 [Hypoxylon trugodes]|uniref:uncharacterized protein n=1 Tax=Hypoxylon trugodes TaxID=326681 RepID=UPI0021998FDE|nr:uncharacterized protein F4822DRAFT_104424 [Hypoxylon trugodes]KAI1391743.1 hypothetical protein F4822DRAFT_104424 [Hypoxylon trugodes]